MTKNDKKDDICICMYPHTRCPGHSSDTDLIISLQKQVADLRENAREIARRDLIAELRQDILSQGVSITDEQGREWIYKESVLALLNKYTDPK